MPQSNLPVKEDLQPKFAQIRLLLPYGKAELPQEMQEEYDSMKADGWSHPAAERAMEIIQVNCEQMEARLSG